MTLIPILLTGALLISCVFSAHSATQSWNPSGAGGGNGTWNTGVTADWDSGVTWTDSNDALFSGTGGTVTLVTPTANSLTFSASGPYLLKSGTLTLSGSDATVNSNVTIASGITATTGLGKSGTGTLILTGNDNIGGGENFNSINFTVNAGVVVIENGGVVSDASAVLDSGGMVTVSGSDSQWTNSGTLCIGNNGEGTLLISNGSTVSTSNNGLTGEVIANSAGSIGTVTVTGSGSKWNNLEDVYVGDGGAGTLLISGGGTVTNVSGHIGSNASAIGTVTVTGSGSTWTNSQELYVGNGGTGTLDIANDGTVSGRSSVIGNGSGSIGSVTVSGSGSEWRTGIALDVGDFGTGTLLISNGGTVYGVTDGEYFSAYCIGYSGGSTGMVTVSGSGSSWINTAGVYVGGFSFGSGGSGFLHITNGGSVSATQMTVWQPGTLALGENATLNSPLVVDGGTMTLVDGQIETVTLTNNTTIDAGSTLDLEVGNGSDQIALSGSGSLSASGASIANLYCLPGFVTAGTDVLISGSITGVDNLSFNVYDGGNFTYSLLNTATSVDLVVTAAAAPLTTAYWKGSQDNIWSILIGGTGSNWATTAAGTTDPHMTPSATTDVIFSANSPANEGNTVLGTDMTIKSLTISDTNAVEISGYNPSDTNTLTISGSTGILINNGAGLVTFGANILLSGSSQTVSVENTAGLIVSGSLGGSFGLYVGGNSANATGAGVLTIIGGGSIGATLVKVWDTGALVLGEGGILDAPLIVDGGTLAFGDAQFQIVTLTVPVTIDAGSKLDFQVGNGTDRFAFSGAGTLALNGASTINLYGLSGLVTSGTGVLIGAATSGHLTLGNVYNSGNFTYSLLSTATSEDVIVTATSGLTSAYWKGGQNNVWSVLVGGTATNWTVGSQGNSQVHLTPSATTDVYFSASGDSNEGNTILGTDMTIKSLTISDTNEVVISGSDPNSWMGTNTLTVSGSTGATGITAKGGAGLVTIGANLYLSGSSQTISVNNAAGLVISGTLGGTNGVIKSGTGVLILTGLVNVGVVFPEYVVDVAEGTLAVQNGGGIVGGGNDEIGDSTGSDAMMTVTGTGSKWISAESFVGNSGTGTLLITSGGAVVSSGYAYLGGNYFGLGEGPAATGIATVSGAGSTWAIGNNIDIGETGTGTLLITGGGEVSSAEGSIGNYPNSVGTVTVTGSGSLWNLTFHTDLDIGNAGTGALLIENGGSVSNGAGANCVLGLNTDSVGMMTVTGAGSNWTSNGALEVGGAGKGTLQITSGGSVVNGESLYGGVIGASAGSVGMVTVTGTGSTWTNTEDLTVGYNGNGTLDISGGGSVSNGSEVWGAAIGAFAGSSGLVSVTGSGSKWTAAGNLYVGLDAGNGTLEISGGALVADEAGNIGGYGFVTSGLPPNPPNSIGAVTVSGTGSTWKNTGDLIVGNSGTGSLVITSGGSVSNGNSAYAGDIGFSAGSSGSVTVTGSGSSWNDASALYIGGSAGGSGGAGLLLIESGGLVSATQSTVWESGALAFGENATLTGPLNVSSGTVTLVDGQVQAVTLTGSTTISAGSNLDFELGNQSDQIAFSGGGSLTVSGTAMVNLYGLSGLVTSGTDVLVSATTAAALSLGGNLFLGNVYNSGNFKYSLVSTAKSEEVVVTAAPSPLTAAYWKGGMDDLWSILVGGTATNWTTTMAGTTDPHLTPSATTDVIFSADDPANESNTVLGTDMTIKSLTISDTNAVIISGSDANSWMGTDTLTISGSTGATGITVNSGAGPVTIGANLELSGSSQTIAVDGATVLLASGTVGSSAGLQKIGTGTLGLESADTLSSALNVNTGSVIVSGSLSGAGPTVVAAGATLEVDGILNTSSTVSGTLAGIGSVDAVTIQKGGTIAPGLTPAIEHVLALGLKILTGGGGATQNNLNSGTPEPGTLTANGNVTLSGTSNFSIRLGVVTATDHDQLTIANGGLISLNDATLQLTIGSMVENPANLGLTYVIINGGAGGTGTNGNIFTQGSTITASAGYGFDILYASDANGDGFGTGNDVVLELVPEPATWATLLCGAVILTLSHRPRQKRFPRCLRQ